MVSNTKEKNKIFNFLTKYSNAQYERVAGAIRRDIARLQS